ncbi:4-hydroxy-tetrahydrodipicolinate reductase [Handroanthus impetiginosus]|uniref:4-hydroxy-tetrahydrodipicolinate reductase n=1 Tax=Handroanthus impetiginosus TaxID=429701 RepID=A0A2G9GNK2_9LAMI|nr:4-hydroxy-tetrahydrodipicolinate reductase [Handroanthus impetiginosus]
MAALSCKFNPTAYKHYRFPKRISTISCSMQTSQGNIKVIINGAAKEIGRAAVAAVTRARGMEVAGAIDSYLVGEDIGKSKENAVVVDFTDPSTVYDNVKQATAFGMKSVVYVPRIKMETISALSAFCEKASMGCLIAPTLSIGSILLQQAAISASFHYNNVEIVESRPNAAGDFPSQDAVQIANNMTNLGQIYNREDISTDNPARGQVVGEDGVRVHSLVLPGLPSSTTVYFSRPGEVCLSRALIHLHKKSQDKRYSSSLCDIILIFLGQVYTLKHDVVDVQALMPGLILAIRKVVRLKNLVYGLEKFL